jgi:hypothetical protein
MACLKARGNEAVKGGYEVGCLKRKLRREKGW